MTIGIAPLCLSCMFLDPAAAEMKCSVYPAGIPKPIVENRADHRGPFPGDNFVMFVQNPDAPAPGEVLVGILGELKGAPVLR